MSVTYILLNLLLQNELESKKIESDSFGEDSKLMLFWQMRLLDIYINLKKIACGMGSR